MSGLQQRCIARHREVTGIFHRSRLWCMRFDKEAPPPPPTSSSPSSNARSAKVNTEKAALGADVAVRGTTISSASQGSSVPPRVFYRPLPASMYPKEVPADFTPFPLPKHDESLGFGPVRLRDVPDIETARLRMASSAAAARSTTTFFEDEVDKTGAAGSAEDLAASMLLDDMASTTTTTAANKVPTFCSTTVKQPSAKDKNDEGNEIGDLGGYHTHPQFPLLDILECNRSVDDLLAQFYNRPQREARTATVLDFAATLQKRSNDELTRILYELSSLFTWDGNGLQFLVKKVVKYGRAYTVTSELTKAFMQLVDAMTVTFVEEQPHRLAESPALFAQVLHFLALVKVMEPNRWYSLTPNSMQNRADYSHPRGINQNTAYVTTGQNLLEFLEDVVTSGHEAGQSADLPMSTATEAGTTKNESDGSNAQTYRLTATWSVDDVLNVLAGFAGIMPDGKAPSAVVAALLDELWLKWSRVDFVLTTPQQAEQLERLYLLLQIMDLQRDAVLDALLGGQLRNRTNGIPGAAPLFCEREDTPPLQLGMQLTEVRGPDFFAAVSKDKRAEVKAAALSVLAVSLAKARAVHDEPLLQALVESGTELLQTLRDKELALTFAQREGFDAMMLHAVPQLSNVADRLKTQDPSWSVYPLTRSVKGGLPDTNAVLAHLRTHPVPYIMTYQGRRVHPVRTFTANLDFVKSMDNVFLLHSSGVSTHVAGLVCVVRRLRSGKDALIVTASCLRALQAAAQYGRTDKIRNRANRALEIVAYELEAGRAVLLPLSEELYLHDAGTYCDEDLMLWTIAAYLARDLPMVKVHTIMSRLSPARNPQHTLKAEFSPVGNTTDLYNASTPLLQSLRSKELRSLTHHPLLQRPVADRPQSLYNVNPIRARFVYRRDKALFDKYHVTARNLAPGFSQGALGSDLRGLGFYTPDHPQLPYTPLSELVSSPIQGWVGRKH